MKLEQPLKLKIKTLQEELRKETENVDKLNRLLKEKQLTYNLELARVTKIHTDPLEDIQSLNGMTVNQFVVHINTIC
jgi:hypothetical protein